MTTDYSAMTNAELLAAYERETDVSERLYIYDMMEVRVNTAPSALEQLRILVDLDAARAEAQRLKGQRDQISDILSTILDQCNKQNEALASTGYVYRGVLQFHSVQYEYWRALLDRIAAEDASAQGGE